MFFTNVCNFIIIYQKKFATFVHVDKQFGFPSSLQKFKIKFEIDVK